MLIERLWNHVQGPQCASRPPPSAACLPARVSCSGARGPELQEGGEEPRGGECGHVAGAGVGQRAGVLHVCLLVLPTSISRAPDYREVPPTAPPPLRPLRVRVGSGWSGP